MLGVDRLVEDLWGQVAFCPLDLGMRTYDVIRTGAYLIQLWIIIIKFTLKLYISRL